MNVDTGRDFTSGTLDGPVRTPHTVGGPIPTSSYPGRVFNTHPFLPQDSFLGSVLFWKSQVISSNISEKRKQ